MKSATLKRDPKVETDKGDRPPPFLLEVTSSTPGESEIEQARERIKVLEKTVRERDQTIRERDLLVGIISHELRTPLTTIFGNAHMLLRRWDDMDAKTRTQAINDIREEAERLNGLVENMLLLARGGVQEPVPTEAVLVHKVLSEVISDHYTQFSHRTVMIDIKPKGLIVEGQPDYLKQVVHNLLGNAEKYSPANEQILLRARRIGTEVGISVLDRGAGVALAEAEVIFQAFYRSGRTSAKVSGAGIGLAVCKLLVQAQSGRIWTRPRRGGGSVFSFTLPAAVQGED